jgi:cardiolipin synthase
LPIHGTWRSLAAHWSGGPGVAGSNPAVPTYACRSGNLTDVTPDDAVRGSWLTLPNVLSGLRLGTVPIFVVLFIAGHTDAAVILYGCAAWTDFFDGWLARRLGQVSELGKFLDPLADRIFILALAVMLVVRGTLVWWLAAGIIVRDVLVLGAYPLIERRGLPRIRVNLVGKAATALLLFGLTWLAVSATGVSWRAFAHGFGFALVLLGVVLYWIATFMYGREVGERLRSSGKAA